jgi:hypothetical protein
MAYFTNINEENIRIPDPSQRMQLIDSNSNIYSYDLFEYSENELYRNAIENSIQEMYNNIEHIRRYEVYERQIIEYNKKQQYEKEKEKEEKMLREIEIKNKRNLEVRELERFLVYSLFPDNMIDAIKYSINSFKNLEKHFIYMKTNYYQSFFELINSKKHRFSQKYIDEFISKQVKEEIDNEENDYFDINGYDEYNYPQENDEDEEE